MRACPSASFGLRRHVSQSVYSRVEEMEERRPVLRPVLFEEKEPSLLGVSGGSSPSFWPICLVGSRSTGVARITRCVLTMAWSKGQSVVGNSPIESRCSVGVIAVGPRSMRQSCR